MSAHHSLPRTDAAPSGWKLVPIQITDEMMAAGDKFPSGSRRGWAAPLASAPAPASGRVDAVIEAWSFLQDRLLEFEQEIGSGEEEREWAGHVHPALSRFNTLIASLSPAETPVSEGEPVATIRFYDARHPEIISYRGQEAGDMKVFAKPASSPAGRDVVGLVAAIIDPEIWAIEQPIPTRGHVEDFHQRRRSSCELAQRVIAALSQSGRVGE